jgi:hypothetical protein
MEYGFYFSPFPTLVLPRSGFEGIISANRHPFFSGNKTGFRHETLFLPANTAPY